MTKVQSLLTNIRRAAESGRCEKDDFEIITSLAKLFYAGEEFTPSDVYAFATTAPCYSAFFKNLILSPPEAFNRDRDYTANRILHDLGPTMDRNFVYSAQKRQIAAVLVDEAIKIVDQLHQQRELTKDRQTLALMIRFSQTGASFPVVVRYTERSASRFLATSSLAEYTGEDVREYARTYVNGVQSFYAYKVALEKGADPDAQALLESIKMPLQRLVRNASQNLESLVLDILGKDEPELAYSLAISCSQENAEINPFYDKALEMAALIKARYPYNDFRAKDPGMGLVQERIKKWTLMHFGRS